MDQEILEGFFEEAKGYLPAMEQLLQQMEGIEDPSECLNELHRLAHSLRGASNMVGMSQVGTMAQSAEEFLDMVLAGESPWDEDSRLLILECVGQIQTAFAELPSSVGQQKPQPENDQINFDEDDNGDLPPELINGFIEEAEGLLDSIGLRMRELDSDGDVKPALLEIRRGVHTIKGAAGMVGFMAINKLGHRMEDLLDHLYEGSIAFNSSIRKLLLGTHDLLIDLVAARGQIGNRRAIFEHLFHQFGAALRGMPLDEAPLPVMTARSESLSEVEAPQVAEAADAPNYVRVPIERLDSLVRLVGELFVSRSIFERHLANYTKEVDELGLSLERLKRLTTQLENDHATYSPGAVTGMNYSSDKSEFDALEFDRYTQLHLLSRDLGETANDVSSVGGQLRGLMNGFDGYLGKQGRLTSEVQDKLMRLRMVPLSSVANRLHRTVRVTAQKRDKDVELIIEGASTELDKTALEQLTGPLEHLLRNAVDHGIESVKDRLEKGKPACGRIRLRATYEGTQVVLRLVDDGRGFDLDKIKKAAVRLDLAGEKEASLLSPSQLHELLFVQGFTTAEEVTEISGRGVGLDIVRSSVEGLKGTVFADSQSGNGTTFTLRLPLTLAITKVLFVESHQQQFAIPISAVAQTARINRNQIDVVDYRTVARLDRGVLPAWYLSESLGLKEMPSGASEARQSVVVLKLGDQEYALLVDKILDSREVMVKPLGELLKRVHGVAGATILGDGGIVLILNPADVVATRQEGRISNSLRKMIAPVNARKALEVLIVDDSLSVRRVIANLMKNTGWNATQAKDGVDALEILSKMQRLPDVVLTDVEMPRMDGFELAATLRGREQYAHIPIIMLTSRSGDKHRNKAASVGVTDYLVKPYLDEVLLGTIKRSIEAAQLTGKVA